MKPGRGLTLGKLVPFEKRRRPARPKTADGLGGQILIFTGVRYERGGAPMPSDGNTPARPKRKRG
jgi:hypothetical protein